MRIGVVGDTHDRLTHVDRIVALFEQARVERVVHTGDITRPEVLTRFARLDVPVVGVYGNNDRNSREELAEQAAQLGMDLCDPPRTIEWAGRRILVVHDPEEISIRDGRAAQTDPPDLVLHGHTHRHRLEVLDETLFFNPGECAGFLEGRNAVGLVDLECLGAELLRF